MVARTISPLISRSISRAINEIEGAAFNPLSLFAAGEQGVWYDPSDLSTLFQDAAGTIPVTAAGQPVGMIRDKSGRGNHATQSTATSRPILQTESGRWYLAFDGVDDWMVTGDVNFTATDKVTTFTGLLKASDTNSAGVVFELSTNSGATTSSFGVFAPSGPALANFSCRSNGSLLTAAAITSTTFPAPITAVLTSQGGISNDLNTLRVNGVQAVASILDQGTGNYANLPMYIGRRGGITLALNGRIYSIIVRGAASSAKQITDTENYVNSKTGAY